MNYQAIFTPPLVSACEQLGLYSGRVTYYHLPSGLEASKGGVMPNTKLLNTIKVDGCQIFYGN